MKNNFLVFGLVSTFLLGGCAQIQPYQDASGAQTAKLRLKMDEPIVSNLFLRSVDVTSCQAGEGFLWLTGGTEKLYTKKVGMYEEKPPAEGILEFTIPANKPMAALSVMHLAKVNFADVMFAMNPIQQDKIRSKQPGMCEAPAFLPLAGEQYEIVYRAGPGTCATNIFHLTKNQNTVSREDITNKLNIKVVADKKGILSCNKP